jgi:PAS domain S-box-containing protein
VSARSDLPSVLLVDDRPENLLALEAVLASLPCRLVSVTSGQEALRRLLHDDFALILLDVQMPELDGFETAEYIKRRRKTRAIPIIFVTAISKERHHVFRGYETGAVDYVFKPYDPQLLRAKVQVFLELYEATRAVQRSEELLRATFDSAPIGMARLDEHATIEQVNQALTGVLGMREGALLGRPFDSVCHPDDVGLDETQRRDLLLGRLATYEVEKRLTSAGGEQIDALLSFSVAREEDGSLRALLVQVQDIRERKAAQRRSRSSCASRPPARRPRRPPSASGSSARSPTRRWRRSRSTTCSPSCWPASPRSSASTAPRWCSRRRARATWSSTRPARPPRSSRSTGRTSTVSRRG